MFKASGIVSDHMNRLKSNRSLLEKDRGAFNIREHNNEFKVKGIKGTYKKASPSYMLKLKAQIAQRKIAQQRKLALHLGILAIIILGLFYMVYGFTF